MHTETLAPKTKNLLTKLSEIGLPENFYLSGGTALALHLGHRESEDLDFFSKKEFNPLKVQAMLEKEIELSEITIDDGTLNCYADGVKLQFLHYPYKLLQESSIYNNIRVSSAKDIVCTKLLTISTRGSKKDFIDLYFALKMYSLPKMFKLLEEKYTERKYNSLHILKSLVFFDDAEAQPMPKMHMPATWTEVKNTITQNVKRTMIL